MSSLIDKLRKLQALAQRGEGGEAHNAQRLLYGLMQKHGVTLDEVVKELPKQQELKYAGMDKAFVIQVICSELGDVQINIYRPEYSKAKVLFFDSTDSEFKFLEAKVRFYWKLYQSEQSKFYEAFIHANNLGAKQSGEEPERHYTKEEMEHIWEIMQLAKGIRKESIFRALSE